MIHVEHDSLRAFAEELPALRELAMEEDRGVGDERRELPAARHVRLERLVDRSPLDAVEVLEHGVVMGDEGPRDRAEPVRVHEVGDAKTGAVRLGLVRRADAARVVPMFAPPSAFSRAPSRSACVGRMT